MKKILALVSFLVIAVACTVEPPANKEPANANKAETKSTTPVSEADAVAREKAIWETLKKKDMDAFGNMLATDYIEVADDGVFNKAGILNKLKDLTVSDVTFADWKMLPIDSDAHLMTYNATIKGSYKGKDFPPGPYRAASVWVNRDGKWQAFYYQETMVKKAETPPATPTPATPGATAKGATPPAAKPLEMSSDVVANEKAVWDTFKTKNYDGFAAVLAPEFMELEPDGAYDKAGTVKSIQQMDAPKFELSDWKAVKVDDDASLVTYSVKGPDGDMRHSTIWANRGGKWMALLHIGTPAAKVTVHPEPK